VSVPGTIGQGSPVTPWEEAVDRVLLALEAGDLVTYGEVALEAGRPGAARSVGTILATSGGRYPWWRVVSASGRLVPGHEAEQARRLRLEGIEVDAERGRVKPRDRR
jgi:methylated-DNA-protein-cysteine methyltransferase related protein